MSAVFAIRHIDARSYAPHDLHTTPRAWGESNCYIDVWIELLSALGCDPVACLPFVVRLDWEADQFTFFKPPLEDLHDLYGVEVQELTPYRGILKNAEEQLRAGRVVLTESDAFYLPDTAGTDYRTQHTKTTIGIQELDVEGRRLGYFHNAGYHELRDADFVGLFRLDAPPDPAFMPLFAELVRVDRVAKLEAPALEARSIALLRKHLARRPQTNPIVRFEKRFGDDLARLRGEGIEAYHQYAFATIRQLGAAFELAAVYLRWLAGRGERELEPSIDAFDAISLTCKSLILKAARAVTSTKPVDLAPMLHELESQWAAGVLHLARRFGA